jgi:hypothetical protein
MSNAERQRAYKRFMISQKESILIMLICFACFQEMILLHLNKHIKKIDGRKQ